MNAAVIVPKADTGASGEDAVNSTVIGIPQPGIFSLIERRGDLMKSDDGHSSLAHCVSVDLHMGKGIATLFRDKFGRVDELRKQNPQCGGVVQLKEGNRFVYYLVTKQYYNNKPTYDTLRNSLIAMRTHCEHNKVTRIMMPRIGCGLDQLEWMKVREMLCDVFGHSKIWITAFQL